MVPFAKPPVQLVDPLLSRILAIDPDAGAGTLRLDVGVLDYVGDVGSAPPAGWVATARRRGLLVVLVATGVDLAAPDRSARIDQARTEAG